jgi:SEC-C motif-containing protein
VTECAEFLRRTWHPATCPSSLEFDPDQRWLGLKIISVCEGGQRDQEGEVAFAARYKIHGKGYRQEETSSFSRLSGNWVYVGGVVK